MNAECLSFHAFSAFSQGKQRIWGFFGISEHFRSQEHPYRHRSFHHFYIISTCYQTCHTRTLSPPHGMDTVTAEVKKARVGFFSLPSSSRISSSHPYARSWS